MAINAVVICFQISIFEPLNTAVRHTGELFDGL